jgi:hypothetical protein
MIAVQYTKFKKNLPKETQEKYSNYFSDFLRLLVLSVERFVIVEFEEGASTQPRDHFFYVWKHACRSFKCAEKCAKKQISVRKSIESIDIRFVL